MDAELNEICEIFAHNYMNLKDKDSGTNDEFVLAGAGIFTAAGFVADDELISRCIDIIGSKRDFFNDFKSRTEFIVRCNMGIYNDPEGFAENFIQVCTDMVVGKRYTDEFNVLSALMLMNAIDVSDTSEYDNIIEEIKTSLNEYTNGSKHAEPDKPYITQAILSGRDFKSVRKDELVGQDILKKGCLKTDKVSVKTVARVISLYEGDLQAKCDTICSLGNALKKAKRSVGQGRVNAILTILAQLGLSIDEAVMVVSEADDCLKAYKPFKGIMGLEAELRRLFAILCVIKRYDSSQGRDTAIAAMLAVYIVIMRGTRTF